MFHTHIYIYIRSIKAPTRRSPCWTYKDGRTEAHATAVEPRRAIVESCNGTVSDHTARTTRYTVSTINNSVVAPPSHPPCVYSRHSFDVVSAESAVRLFKDKGSGVGAYWSPREEREKESVALGLTDRREYNGFVPLMDEGDPLKTTVMRIFSGLQVRLRLLIVPCRTRKRRAAFFMLWS